MNSEEVITTLEDGVRIIQVNRPKSRNAFDSNVYNTISKTLNTDAENDGVVITIITGTGEYYSSGFDIKSAMTTNLEKGMDEVKNMIQAFIIYPKLLVALINGPAIGVAVTTAALCDIVYASERATFETPFLRMGLCAEACSSFTFPNIMGRSKASEMLFLGKKMTAQEAYQFGFVAEVVPHEQWDQFIGQLKRRGSSLSVNSVKNNKRLILDNYKNILWECCDREFEQVVKCLNSVDFSDAVAKFLSRKEKV